MNWLLKRFRYEQDATLGVLIVFDDAHNVIFSCKTIEPPWRNNARGVSCVPAGEYDLLLEYSAKFQMKLWELKGVPGRSECKFHVANFARQLEGCVGVGDKHIDIDSDRVTDVTNSRDTLEKLHAAMGDRTRSRLRIVGAA